MTRSHSCVLVGGVSPLLCRWVLLVTGVLEGVTRRTVIEIAEELGFTVERRPLPLAELMGSAEVFLSSSAGGVMAITKVDDVTFGGGVPGEITRRIRERYWEWMARPELRVEIDYASAE